MTTVTHSAVPTCSLQEIEHAVETPLQKQLLADTMRASSNAVEREHLNLDYADFAAWAAWYGLPPTPHVVAAYLLELAHECGADIDRLKRVANAIFHVHDIDVHVPIRAALNYCAR